MRSLLVVLLLSGLTVAPVRAAIWYVDRDAPGPAHDGTAWATAFTSFNSGANAAYPGDEVWVAEGVYDTFPVSLRASVGYYGGFAGTETAREAADPERHLTVLDAGGRRTLLNGGAAAGSGTVLDGFTLTGTSPQGTASGSLLYLGPGASPTVRRCVFTGSEGWGEGAVRVFVGAPLFDRCDFRDNADTGVYIGHKSSAVFTDCSFTDNSSVGLDLFEGQARLTRCVFYGNGTGLAAYNSRIVVEACEVRGNGGRGISLSYCPEATVRACRIIGNAGHGIAVDLTPAFIASNLIADNAFLGTGIGIMCGSGAPVIENNTIAGHYGADGGAIVMYAGPGYPVASPAIRNNLLAGNSAAVRAWPGTNATPDLSHNCAWDNDADYAGIPDPTGTNGSIYADPRLARPDDGNFHIQPDSPCRDAGEGSDAGMVDMDGQPRVQGSRVDIGADESDGSVWPAISRVVRVRPTGDDTLVGSEWSNAKRTIGAALTTFGAEGGEVWVADGTYPERVALPPFVRLYGGFAGNEAARRAYPDGLFSSGTVLDGGAGGSVVTVGPGGARNVVQGLVIQNGRSARGAGFHVQAGSSARVLSNTIRDNAAVSAVPNSRSAGGGLAATAASVIMLHNHIAGNRSASGGGVSLSLGEFTLEGNVVEDNEAEYEVPGEPNQPGRGGGVLVSQAGVTMTDNLVQNNRAGYGSGLMFTSQYGTAGRIQRNTFQGNVASRVGGGVFLAMAVFEPFSSNVLVDNHAGERGGGLEVSHSGAPIVNNTFAGNNAPLGGAMDFQTPPRLVANNTFAFNTSGLSLYYEPDWYYIPGPLAVSGNLFFANAAGDFTGPADVPDPTVTFGNIKADPQFVDRAAGDYHLRPGSPAIDAGTDVHVQPADTDRDGRPRIQGRHVDLGAYETPGALGYRWWDALRAMRLSGGLDSAADGDWRLDIAGDPRLSDDINLSDAARLARKASGLEP